VRRSDRLFEIIQIVRDGRLHLARDIAEKLEVSIRTIYRDLDTLVASGIPIEGERGVGYLLREPIFLPPLNLSNIELEALHFGMAIVANTTDCELQKAAQSLLLKINQVALASASRKSNYGFSVYGFEQAKAGFQHMAKIREAIRQRQKLQLVYADEGSKNSQRLVRPLQMEFWGRVWTCACWCELRHDFRVFRVDRIASCELTSLTFELETGKSFEDFREKNNFEKTD
jgi:predicted DNA-binding transcriptional regulator YafY